MERTENSELPKDVIFGDLCVTGDHSGDVPKSDFQG
jgi:hypothetical protein